MVGPCGDLVRKNMIESQKATRWFSEKIILFIAILTANVSQFIHIPIWGRSRPIFIALLLLSLITRSWRTIACTLVFALMSLDGIIIPPALNGAPVIGFLIPFLIAAACLLPFPQTRSNFAWIKKGEIDRVSWILTIATSLFSTLALVLWAFWTNNLGLGEQFVKSFGQVSKLVIFAVHYATGFPNGIIGYLMVLVYGTMLGYLRMRTKGILAPYVAHVIADATIAMLLVYLVK
jgi:hypothetical protein